MNAKFEIFKDIKGEYRFRLRAPNNEIIAQSEGYTTKQNCENGIIAIKNYASDADIIDLTKKFNS